MSESQTTVKAAMTITRDDVDIANDVCRAVLEKCGKGDWPVYGLRREDLFNIVAARVAMQRAFMP